jgi:hypothetical protein
VTERLSRPEEGTSNGAMTRESLRIERTQRDRGEDDAGAQKGRRDDEGVDGTPAPEFPPPANDPDEPGCGPQHGGPQACPHALSGRTP